MCVVHIVIWADIVSLSEESIKYGLVDLVGSQTLNPPYNTIQIGTKDLYAQVTTPSGGHRYYDGSKAASQEILL